MDNPGWAEEKREEDYYSRQIDGPLPVKVTTIEEILERIICK